MNLSRPPRRRTSEIEDTLRYVFIIPTELQGKILGHLCTTTNASYQTLTKEIGRGRITILQSIESLIKHGYIEKQKVNPQKEKSKLTFLPTLKGVACLWKYYRFDLKKMVKIKEEDEVTTYVQFVRDVFKFEHQRPMLSRLFDNIEYNYYIFKTEDAERRRLIKESFTMGILELTQRRDYDPTKLFNEKGVQWLTKLYSREELNEFKELFVRTKQNLATIIERLRV